MIRVLLDENISPALVRRFGDMGVYAQSVPHVGLSGRPDREIWKYALDHDFAVVTTNARDFIPLLNAELHPRLIVLRENGLTRDEQWDRIRAQYSGAAARRLEELKKASSKMLPRYRRWFACTSVRLFFGSLFHWSKLHVKG